VKAARTRSIRSRWPRAPPWRRISARWPPGAGIGWVMLGLSALGPVPLQMLLAVLVTPALLLWGGLSLRQKTQDIPDAEWSPKVSRIFWQATIGEIVGIVLILGAAIALHRPEYILPLISLAVGLHFFPLAHAMRRPLYHVTGALLCLIGLVTLLTVPTFIDMGAYHHLQGRLLIGGVSGGATLWGSALVMLIQSAAGLPGKGTSTADLPR